MFKLCTLALLIIVSLCACPSQYCVGEYTFNINYTTDDCSMFDFINCTYQVSNPDDQFKTITTDYWGACLYESCKLSYADLTTDTLKSCNEYVRKQKDYITAIIVMSCLLGILAPCAIALFCSIDKRYCWQAFKASWKQKCPCCQENVRPMGSKVANSQMNQSSAVLQEQISRNLPQWQPISLDEMLLKDRSTCSICLEAKPFVRLECSHSFHINCILTSASKDNNCPQCRTSIQTKIITKICEKCFLRKRVIEALQQSEIHKICSHCQSEQLEKVSVIGKLREQHFDNL